MKRLTNSTVMMTALAAVASVFLWFSAPARAQMQPGLPAVNVGYCQTPAASLASAIGFSGCVAASFTGTCSGTVLTASAVTGQISPGWPLSGTGIVAGTFVQSNGTGTGGAGTYNTSQACTSSGASLTAVGPPNGANFVMMQSETQNIRWRDDGAAPTTTVGMLLNTTATFPTLYNGQMGKVQFIDATAGGLLDAAFYKTSSP
jgi:hypothetical protein